MSRSTSKAEHKVLVNGIAKMMWIQPLLHELHVSNSLCSKLLVENRCAKYLVFILVFHARTKCIEVGYHFIRE